MAKGTKKSRSIYRIDRIISKLLISMALGLITVYRYLLSPWVGNQCRFHPTCSHYVETALKEHGFIKGCALGLLRIAKCNPWHQGGLDEVPARKKPASQYDADHQHSHN